MVSPQLALFNAVCKSPPTGTLMTLPDVLGMVVSMHVTGNCAGPSLPDGQVAGDAGGGVDGGGVEGGGVDGGGVEGGA